MDLRGEVSGHDVEGKAEPIIRDKKNYYSAKNVIKLINFPNYPVSPSITLLEN